MAQIRNEIYDENGLVRVEYIEVDEPTQEEIRNFDKPVFREVEDSWRHGYYVFEVYHREEDDTYWGVNYKLSTDGETNGLRDNEYCIEQVTPHRTTMVEYIRIAN